MKKISFIFGIVLIIAFVVLTLQSMRSQVDHTKDAFPSGQENVNIVNPAEQFAKLLPEITPLANGNVNSPLTNTNVNTNESTNTSQCITSTNTKSDTVGLKNFCSQELDTVKNEVWYQNFIHSYNEVASSEGREVTQICAVDYGEKISFVEVGEDGFEQIGWWDNTADVIEKPRDLGTQGDKNTDPEERYYSVNGWMHDTSFSYAEYNKVREQKDYYSYNIETEESKQTSSCEVTTQTLTCGEAEATAWGCNVNSTTMQQKETCRDME